MQEKKEMISLTNEEEDIYIKSKSKYCHICNKEFKGGEKDKYYAKIRDHDHYFGKFRGAAHSICNLRYQEQREIPVVLHNGSNYDFHLIIKELAKEFRTDMRCLGENTEKYISFNIPLKIENAEGKKVICRLKFINSYRFLLSLQEDLTDNLSEITVMTCKSCKEKYKTNNECNYIALEDNRLKYKCTECNKHLYKPITPIKENFTNTYRLCNKDLNKFVLLLRKDIYPYEYMDSWEKFNEETPPKKEFYSKLNLKDITDEEYKHALKVWDTFNITNLGEYHDLYVQADTLQLADIFRKFCETCLEIYQLDTAYFVSTTGLA